MIMSGVYSNLNLCTHIYTHTQITMRERERERERESLGAMTSVFH